jgi:aminodeoxyfutalosine synthase
MITLDEAKEILDTRNLLTAGARGDEERRRRHAARTTFVRVLELPVSQIPAALPPVAFMGELRLTGAVDAPTAAAAVRRARALAGSTPLTGFSLHDLLATAGGVQQVRTLCQSLADAGLDAVADAAIDRLDDPAAAIDAARSGGLRVLRLVVRQAGDALRLAERAREIQARVGGLQAFAPLPLEWSVAQPSTGYDDVKYVAVARLLADNIPSIQVDWARYGPKLAQVALTTGADDVDGVSPFDGDLGRRRGPLEEITGNISAAGLEAVERNGLFAHGE